MNSGKSILFILSASTAVLIGLSFFSIANACEETIDLDHTPMERPQKEAHKAPKALKSKKSSKSAKGSQMGPPTRVRIIDTGAKSASADKNEFPMPEINDEAPTKVSHKKSQRKQINEDPIVSDDDLMHQQPD